MAFQKPRKQPQFADLKGILAQTKKSENSLYQTVEQIIERLTQFQQVTLAEIADINQSVNDVLSEITQVNTVTNIFNPQMPFFPDASGGDDVQGEIGPPGPQGIQGIPGIPGAAGIGGINFFWAGDEELEFVEPFPVVNLHSQNRINGRWTFLSSFLTLQGSTPQYQMTDVSAAANEKMWRMVAAGTLSIQTVDDAFTASDTAMVFRRSGNTPTVIEANVPDFRVVDVDPIITLKDTDGAADEKIWRYLAFGNRFLFQSNNDAESGAVTHFELQKSGNTPTFAKFHFGLVFSGVSAVSLTADQTAWNPTGLGTVFMLEVTPSVGGWIIRGITAQTAGTIICIFNVTTTTFQINHEDAAASASNRIRLTGGSSILMSQYRSLILCYNATLSRWVNIATS